METLYAEPIPVETVSECKFYHAIDLPRSGSQNGDWDLRGKFDKYIGSVPLSGKTVLDVGTASGFLTFEAEKRGARVVSVDAISPKVWDRIAIRQSSYATNRARWEDANGQYMAALKRSYWLAHREFNSNAKAYYGNIYELPAELGQYDVVIVGQILVHLSNVIQALTSVADRCADTLVIAEGMIDNNQPISRFLARADAPDNNASFWHHSTGLYRELMACLGFRLQSKSDDNYQCNVIGWDKKIKITTMVFQRTR